MNRKLLLAGLGTALSSVLAFFLCVEMGRAKDCRPGQIDGQCGLATAMHGSVIATVYQAMAATESVRPSVELVLGKPEITDHDMGIGFSLNNGGKIAALRVRLAFRMVFIGSDSDPKSNYPEKQTAHGYDGRFEPGQGAGSVLWYRVPLTGIALECVA